MYFIRVMEDREGAKDNTGNGIEWNAWKSMLVKVVKRV